MDATSNAGDALIAYSQLAQMTDAQLTQLFGVRDFFIYELDFSGIAPGQTQTNSFTVQADSNFLWQEGCFFADVAAAGQTNNSRVLPLCTFVILDTASGRQLSSNPVPVVSQFGYGSEPYTLPSPRFFRANSQVTVNLTNYDAAQTYNLKLSFIGTKFFKFAQMG